MYSSLFVLEIRTLSSKKRKEPDFSAVIGRVGTKSQKSFLVLCSLLWKHGIIFQYLMKENSTETA